MLRDGGATKTELNQVKNYSNFELKAHLDSLGEPFTPEGIAAKQEADRLETALKQSKSRKAERAKRKDARRERDRKRKAEGRAFGS